MTLQNRNKILLLIVIVLTIVNVAAVLTVLYNIRVAHNYIRADGVGILSDSIKEQRGPDFLIRELGFDKGQQERFHQSHRNFREVSRPVFVEMRKLNASIIEEVSKEQPDTAALRQMCLRDGELHTLVKLNTVSHLREVSKIATPEQQEKLAFFYRELLSHDDGPRGKGMQHQYRHGKNRSKEK